jgi:hypothetical protein
LSVFRRFWREWRSLKEVKPVFEQELYSVADDVESCVTGEWLQEQIVSLQRMIVKKTHDWEQLETRLTDLESEVTEPGRSFQRGQLRMLTPVHAGWSSRPEYRLSGRQGTFFVVLTHSSAVHEPGIWGLKPATIAPERSLAVRLAEMRDTLAEIEANFDDVQRRIVLCDGLERTLDECESVLNEVGAQHLQWIVSLLKDAMSYNFAEDMTDSQREAIKGSIGLIGTKGERCTEADYSDVHRRLLESGLCLLPNSKKAVERYDEHRREDRI